MLSTADPIPRERSESTYGAGAYEMPHWRVDWSAVFVGALSALAVITLLGLVGAAIGASYMNSSERLVDVKKISLAVIVFSVCTAFFAFVVAGWVAGKIAGFRYSEPSMLHGAVAWLIAVPLLGAMVSVGIAGFGGGWYGGLVTAHGSDKLPFERPADLSANATEQQRTAHEKALADFQDKRAQWEADTPKVVRNTALCTITSMLLSLIGAVVGGWMACGEPMTFTHYRRRTAHATTA